MKETFSVRCTWHCLTIENPREKRHFAPCDCTPRLRSSQRQSQSLDRSKILFLTSGRKTKAFRPHHFTRFKVGKTIWLLWLGNVVTALSITFISNLYNLCCIVVRDDAAGSIFRLLSALRSSRALSEPGIPLLVQIPYNFYWKSCLQEFSPNSIHFSDAFSLSCCPFPFYRPCSKLTKTFKRPWSYP